MKRVKSSILMVPPTFIDYWLELCKIVGSIVGFNFALEVHCHVSCITEEVGHDISASEIYYC